MDVRSLFDYLRKFDTPTIANAVEIALGTRQTTGFTRQRMIAAFPKLAPIIGFARTAMVRCSQPFDGVARKQKLFGYYEYVAHGDQPTISVVQDVDSLRGLGAFWGEVNTNVHCGLGCLGAVTDGSMRDLEMMCPQFQCIAAVVAPSHGFVQVVDFGSQVDILGMAVSSNDIVHADHHGAIVIPKPALEKLPAAIDLMTRREKVILDAARSPGFDVAKLRAAYAASEQIN